MADNYRRTVAYNRRAEYLGCPDVDQDKVALIGYSAGDYFAPRAAAGEPRIKACIANTLVVDCGETARAGLKGLHNAQVIDLLFSVLMRRAKPKEHGNRKEQVIIV